MPYHDLNFPYSSQTPASVLAHDLSFASDLGYSVIALSVSINGKIPAVLPTVPVSTISRPPNVDLLSRLTLTIGDTSQNHRLALLSSSFSLVALRPTNEKSFQLCCGSLDCDIISLDFSQRLPFILKFKTVSSALQRGIRFEICYSSGLLGGTDARRNVISGATSLIRATRGRGIILSSEAKTALGLRAPQDVMNLVQVWGLGQERGKEAVCEEADRVVRLARLRRETYRGVIRIVENGGPSEPQKQSSKAADSDTSEALDNPAQSSDPNGVKRKASTTSLDAGNNATATDNQPVSKREQKRRAKKARLEAQNQDKTKKEDSKIAITNNSFPIEHEALLSASTKVSKKG